MPSSVATVVVVMDHGAAVVPSVATVVVMADHGAAVVPVRGVHGPGELLLAQRFVAVRVVHFQEGPRQGWLHALGTRGCGLRQHGLELTELDVPVPVRVGILQQQVIALLRWRPRSTQAQQANQNDEETRHRYESAPAGRGVRLFVRAGIWTKKQLEPSASF